MISSFLSGILYYSIWLQDEKYYYYEYEDDYYYDGTNNTHLVSAYALSNVILPHISEHSASIIDKNLIQPITNTTNQTDALTDGPTEIFKVLQNEIMDKGINCEDIGEHELGGLCPTNSNNLSNLDVSQPTSLSGGLYITTTNVGDK